jgi:hypothetical protein
VQPITVSKFLGLWKLRKEGYDCHFVYIMCDYLLYWDSVSVQAQHQPITIIGNTNWLKLIQEIENTPLFHFHACTFSSSSLHKLFLISLRELRFKLTCYKCLTSQIVFQLCADRDNMDSNDYYKLRCFGGDRSCSVGRTSDRVSMDLLSGKWPLLCVVTEPRSIPSRNTHNILCVLAEARENVRWFTFGKKK